MTPPHIEEVNMGTSFIRSPEVNPKLPQRTSDSIDLALPDAPEASRFLNDTDLKAEIDTGDVSEQWFSFKKLWAYAGPGKVHSLSIGLILRKSLDSSSLFGHTRWSVI